MATPSPVSHRRSRRRSWLFWCCDLLGIRRDAASYVFAASLILIYLPVSSLFFIFESWFRLDSFTSVVVFGAWLVLVGSAGVHYYLCLATGPGVVPRRWDHIQDNKAGDNRYASGTPDSMQPSLLRPSASDSSLDFEKKRSWIDLFDDPEKMRVGDTRYCRFCDLDKPPRAHHCRRCNRCILRMDHHCPWIGGCVGFYNQAHFNRFIFCATLASIMTLLLIIGRVHSIMTNFMTNSPQETNHLSVIVTSLNVTILVPLSSILCMFAYNQLRLLLLNRTTIEDVEIREDGEFLESPPVGLGVHRDRHPYDLGWFENIKAILGPNPFLWFVPQRINGDGMTFARFAPMH